MTRIESRHKVCSRVKIPTDYHNKRTLTPIDVLCTLVCLKFMWTRCIGFFWWYVTKIGWFWCFFGRKRVRLTPNSFEITFGYWYLSEFVLWCCVCNAIGFGNFCGFVVSLIEVNVPITRTLLIRRNMSDGCTKARLASHSYKNSWKIDTIMVIPSLTMGHPNVQCPVLNFNPSNIQNNPIWKHFPKTNKDA